METTGKFVLGFIVLMVLLYLFVTNPTLFYISLFLGITCWILKSGIKILKEYERAIVFRFGRFNRVAGPGLVFIIPGIEKIYQIVDIRVKAIPISIKGAFTNDGAKVDIYGVLYYRIYNPRKAILNVDDFRARAEQLIESDIRDLIAAMTLKELFANVEIINDLIMKRLSPMLMNWGIDLKSVQIRRIVPAPEIEKMLVKRRAMEEEYMIRKMMADARRIAIKALGEGARYLDDRSLLYLYMLALQELSKKVQDVDIVGTGLLGTPPKDLGNLNQMLKNMGITLPTAIAMIKNVMENEAKEEMKKK